MPRRRTAEVEPAVALDARAARRRNIGALRQNRVDANTYKRYAIHAVWFHRWCLILGHSHLETLCGLDTACGDYIEFLWGANQNLSLATGTLSALQHFLHERGTNTQRWSLIAVWRSTEPPCRAP